MEDLTYDVASSFAICTVTKFEEKDCIVLSKVHSCEVLRTVWRFLCIIITPKWKDGKKFSFKH